MPEWNEIFAKNVTFTDPSVIARVAAKLNAMHTSGAWTSYYCEAFSGGYTVIFEPKPRKAARIVVSQVPCFFADFKIAGKDQPTLGGSTGFDDLVDHLVRYGAPGH